MGARFSYPVPAIPSIPKWGTQCLSTGEDRDRKIPQKHPRLHEVRRDILHRGGFPLNELSIITKGSITCRVKRSEESFWSQTDKGSSLLRLCSLLAL